MRWKEKCLNLDNIECLPKNEISIKMKLNDVELQLNKKSEQYIKLLQEQSVVKKENEKLITKCKNENIKNEQIQTLLLNTQNELKILKLKNDMNNNSMFDSIVLRSK